MGRKKAAGVVAQQATRPFCFFCDRTFDDETVLLQHQRAKHFRCPECDDGAVRGKCESVQGLIVHTLKVHGKALARVPNALQGRDNPELNVYGMDGIPADVLRDKGYCGDRWSGAESRAPSAPPSVPNAPNGPNACGVPGLPGLPGMPMMPGAPGMPRLPGPAGTMPAMLPAPGTVLPGGLGLQAAPTDFLAFLAAQGPPAAAGPGPGPQAMPGAGPPPPGLSGLPGQPLALTLPVPAPLSNKGVPGPASPTDSTGVPGRKRQRLDLDGETELEGEDDISVEEVRARLSRYRGPA